MAKRPASQTVYQRSRNVRPVDKAIFHQITGAGKSHIKRQFFGLSDADVKAIEDEVDLSLAVNLQSEGSRSA